jgi:hypothetical protein
VAFEEHPPAPNGKMTRARTDTFQFFLSPDPLE